MTVRDEMVNGLGVTHGGIAFSLADSAFAFACNTHGKVTVSVDNSITYPAPIRGGDVLTAVAKEDASSGRLSYYRAEVTNQRGEVVALFRGTAFKTSREHLTSES
jgi:acyl-CoA thioesterase